MLQVPFIPDSVTLTPDPPVIGGDVDFAIQGKAGAAADRKPCGGRIANQCTAGAPLTIHAPATGPAPAADRGVNAGSLDILVFFADTQIYEESDDLCGKTSCPIAPGVINIHYTQVARWRWPCL